MTAGVGAKKNGLMQDLRHLGVTDAKVLAALDSIPREAFVAKPFLEQAWENHALPIGQGQTISQPLVVGLMTQALELTDRHKVLEIGTGSGYQAAILAKLCRRLYTIERHRPLLIQAVERFHDLRLHNVTWIGGDGTKGWPEQAPFDRIMVTAAAYDVPPLLADQLKEGGIMVLPMGDPNTPDQDVVRVRKTAYGLDIEHLFPVRFVPLVAGIPD